jgi:putative tricarboxylic transport membrane protein
MEMLQGLGQGFQILLSYYNLLACAVTAVVGAILAFLPGMRPIVGLGLALPVMFGLPPVTAITVGVALCFGIQYGRAAAAFHRARRQSASAGGFTLAPVARVAFAAVIGGVVVALLVAGLVPVVVKNVWPSFWPSEYAGFIIVLLLSAAALASDSILRALAVISFGLLLSTIGTDLETGEPRLTFGMADLSNGVGLLPLALGVLMLPEVIRRLGIARADPTAPNGQVPLGRESVSQIAGTAAATNAGLSASFLPMLAVGLPVSAVTLIFLGLLSIHGAVPGPQFATGQPELFWAFFAAIIVANLLLLLVVLTWGGLFARLDRMSDHRIVAPAVLIVVCVGAYQFNNSLFDVAVMAIFGTVSYYLLKSDRERNLLLTSFVLGPLLEENLRRSMLIGRGDVWAIINRPIVALLLAAGVAVVVAAGLCQWRQPARRVD